MFDNVNDNVLRELFTAGMTRDRFISKYSELSENPSKNNKISG